MMTICGYNQEIGLLILKMTIVDLPFVNQNKEILENLLFNIKNSITSPKYICIFGEWCVVEIFKKKMLQYLSFLKCL